METNRKEISGRKMVTGPGNLQMGSNMQGSLKTVKGMEKGHGHTKMVESTLENLKMENLMEKEHITGQMGISTQAHSKTIKD